MIPLPGVPTLFLDVKTSEDITDSKDPRPLHDFRGFKQVHNLHLQMVQEMGFIREIDQAFSKSLMVEFLRLKVITGDDLSETLWTWQANMEATTDKFLRDLDAATQTSTTLPSKNAAVGVALCQF